MMALVIFFTHLIITQQTKAIAFYDRNSKDLHIDHYLLLSYITISSFQLAVDLLGPDKRVEPVFETAICDIFSYIFKSIKCKRTNCG